ncbi:MAG TPA: flavin reductase family protein [Mycobacteriales bacterium]|nr:flavin reductase family protein [Mycobacteriales bacterium]
MPSPAATDDPRGTPGAAALEILVASLDYPMVVVTAAAGEVVGGCLVGFWSQCSIDPPRLLVCLSKRNHTYRVASRARALAVHFLRSDNLGLARLFGEQTGDEVDKLAQLEWRAGLAGVPVISGVRGWVAGPVHDRMDLGDHVGHVVDVVGGGVEGDAADSLTFQHVRDFQPGHDA